MTWPPAIQEIIEEFQDIEDQFEKLEVLMDFSSQLLGVWSLLSHGKNASQKTASGLGLYPLVKHV